MVKGINATNCKDFNQTQAFFTEISQAKYLLVLVIIIVSWLHNEDVAL